MGNGVDYLGKCVCLADRGYTATGELTGCISRRVDWLRGGHYISGLYDVAPGRSSADCRHMVTSVGGVWVPVSASVRLDVIGVEVCRE